MTVDSAFVWGTRGDSRGKKKEARENRAACMKERQRGIISIKRKSRKKLFRICIHFVVCYFQNR